MTNYRRTREFRAGAAIVAILFLINIFLPHSAYAIDLSTTEFKKGSGNLTENPNDRGGIDYNAQLDGKSLLKGTDFNLGANDRLFVEGGDLMMKVSKGYDPTYIYGDASSQDYLGWFNPAGVHIGDTAHIDAQGVIVSGLTLTSADFLNGKYVLGEEGSAGGLVVNRGDIRAKDFVLLAGGAVENSGTINAPLKEVHIAAGDVITVGLNGNGSISVGIDKETASTVYDSEGNPITDQIKNTGTINANHVSLQAKAAKGIFDYAINQEGIIRVNAVKENKGVIELVANGDVKNTGTLEAKKGGIRIEGEDIVSSGTLIAKKLVEKGASFKLSGNYIVKQSEINNLDGAINLGTGNYSGIIADVGDIIVDPNAVLTLVGDLAFIADVDGNNTGIFFMDAGSSILGNNYGLEIHAGGLPTVSALPPASILRDITGVHNLALDHSGQAPPFSTVIYVLASGETISATGNMNLGPVHFRGMDNSTLHVGGGVNVPNSDSTLMFTDSAAGNLGNGSGGNLQASGGQWLFFKGFNATGAPHDVHMEGNVGVLQFRFLTGAPPATQQWNMQGDLTVTDSLFVQRGIVNMGTNDLNMAGATGTWLGQRGLQPNGNNVYINNNAKIEYEALATSPGGFGLKQGTLTNVIYNTNVGTVEYTGDARGYGVQAGEYHNLVLSTTSFLSQGGTILGDTTVHGDLTIGANAGMQVGEDINGNGYTLSMGDPATGTFSNDGMLTFVDDGHAVNMTNDADSGIIRHLDYQGGTYNLPLGNDYNTLILYAIGGGFTRPATWNATGDVTINDSLLLSNVGTNLDMGTHDLNMANATGTFLNQHGLQYAYGNNVFSMGTIEYDVQPTGLFGFGTEQGTLTNVIYNRNFGTVRYTGNVVFGYDVQGGNYHDLEIDANAIFGGAINGNATVHGDLTITGNGALNVADGTTLDTRGGFSNDGRLIVTDNGQLQNFTNDIDSGAVWYLDTQGNTYNNLEAGTAYNDVWFISADLATGGAGNGNWTPQGNLDIDGDFLHIGGTFNAPAQINVAGDFVRDIGVGITGTFNANGGTVILDGANQMITGNTTFNNLEKIGPNETLLFQAGSTQTITGTATLRGDATGRLTLNRVSGSVNIGGFDFNLGPSGRWNIDPQGTRDISFVRVGNSENLTGPAINPLNSVNLGNTTLWFGPNNPGGGGGGGFGNTGNISNALLEEEQPQLPGIEIGDTFLKNKVYHCAATQAGIDMPSSVHNGVMLNAPDEKLPVGICGEIIPNEVGFGADEFQTNTDSFVPFQFVA